MSESSYNNSSGESSYGSSDKYQSPTPAPASYYHAPSSGDYNDNYKRPYLHKPEPEPLTQREQNIIKAKAVLRDCEESLLNSANHLTFLEKTDYLKNFVRNLVVNYKEVLIESPTYSTVYAIYEQMHENLPLEEQKSPLQNIIIDILCEKVAEEKRNNSELKYW